jgi:virginiamycin B lyase
MVKIFHLGNAPKIGRITTAGVITEFAASGPYSSLARICVGPDGNLWFTDRAIGRIGKITTAGVVTLFALAGSTAPWGITSGPDGNLWFAGTGSNKIGRITTGGLITEFSIPTFNSFSTGIVIGSDGNLWFNEAVGQIGKITTSGTITEFPSGGTSPTAIAAGPDGNLWFTDGYGLSVGRITPTGVVTRWRSARLDRSPTPRTR